MTGRKSKVIFGAYLSLLLFFAMDSFFSQPSQGFHEIQPPDQELTSEGEAWLNLLNMALQEEVYRQKHPPQYECRQCGTVTSNPVESHATKNAYDHYKAPDGKLRCPTCGWYVSPVR